MADIIYHFPIKASAQRVFDAVSTPEGLDTWWTKRSAGEAVDGAEYQLWFGPDFDWRATVSRCVKRTEFELTLTVAQKDWLETRVGFLLEEREGLTQVRFYHRGWPETNDNFSISSFFWAMYLRLLRRYVEHGEVVPYENRLDA